jgi:hypothetical protein
VDDWDDVTEQTRDNYLLRTIERMRAAGYTDEELTAGVYSWPRPATLFAAFLRREKGFVHEHFFDVNFGHDRWVLSDDDEEAVRAYREQLAGEGCDPMQPVYYERGEEE